MSTSAKHTTAEQRALYVMDALEPDQREQLEEHALSCPACHASLMAEARFEMTLRELSAPPPIAAPAVAPRPLIDEDRLPASAWRGRPVRLTFFALSAAAALVLLLRADPTATPQRWPVTAERRLSDRIEQELTLQEQAEMNEALVCDRLPLPRICAWDDTAVSARVIPAALQVGTCDSDVPPGVEQTTCALPAAGAELRDTCGP